MKKIVVISFCASLFIIFGHSECPAFRCGDGFVSGGETKTKALLECGQPTSKEKSGIKKEVGESSASGTSGGKKSKSRKNDKRKNNKTSSSLRGEYDNTSKKGIEKWYYNCGDNDFIYVLTFEGSILKKEDTAGYGKGKSDCKGKGR